MPHETAGLGCRRDGVRALLAPGTRGAGAVAGGDSPPHQTAGSSSSQVASVTLALAPLRRPALCLSLRTFQDRAACPQGSATPPPPHNKRNRFLSCATHLLTAQTALPSSLSMRVALAQGASFLRCNGVAGNSRSRCPRSPVDFIDLRQSHGTHPHVLAYAWTWRLTVSNARRCLTLSLLWRYQ